MKQTTTKKLEAAHYRWLRKILHVSWKDEVTNEKIRQLTQQVKIENIIRERRMRWTGACDEHGLGVDNVISSVRWTPPNGERKSGRPRADWIQTAKEDIKGRSQLGASS